MADSCLDVFQTVFKKVRPFIQESLCQIEMALSQEIEIRADSILMLRFCLLRYRAEDLGNPGEGRNYYQRLLHESASHDGNDSADSFFILDGRAAKLHYDHNVYLFVSYCFVCIKFSNILRYRDFASSICERRTYSSGVWAVRMDPGPQMAFCANFSNRGASLPNETVVVVSPGAP